MNLSLIAKYEADIAKLIEEKNRYRKALQDIVNNYRHVIGRRISGAIDVADAALKGE